MEIPIAVALRLAGVNAMQEAAARDGPNNARFKANEENHDFNPRSFIDSVTPRGKLLGYGSGVAVYTQGDAATRILYVQEGGVKRTVVNADGKEAVVAIAGPGEFLGEGCLVGQPRRVSTAVTIIQSTILAIEKGEMTRLLHAERPLAKRFITYIISRNNRVQEDLIHQILDSTEKRLARTLLQLAHYGKEDNPKKMIPDITQEILAEMIGTTRTRVNFFMNKFRKQGYIEYSGKLRGLQINKSLLSVALND